MTTAAWLAEHRPEVGGTEEQVLTDPFDYEAEDRLMDAWRNAGRGRAGSREGSIPSRGTGSRTAVPVVGRGRSPSSTETGGQ